jgi:hypothetical protein
LTKSAPALSKRAARSMNTFEANPTLDYLRDWRPDVRKKIQEILFAISFIWFGASL